MTEFFFTKPFFALILTAAISSLFGVFTLWKRLSYFGDALSHSILLGVALASLLNIEQDFMLIFCAVIFALLAMLISRNQAISRDTIIAISSYFCIALAMLINNLSGKNFDFTDYIFGNIDNVSNFDIAVLAAIFIITIFFTFFAFKKILLINFAPDLAKVSGIKINFWDNIFTILLAISIAIIAKIVGILLITAFLVLPAAIARILSKSAAQMLGLSIFIALISCLICGFFANILYVQTASLAIVFLCLTFFTSLLL